MLLNTTKDSKKESTPVFLVFCCRSFVFNKFLCVNNICSIYWTSPNIGSMLGFSFLFVFCCLSSLSIQSGLSLSSS